MLTAKWRMDWAGLGQGGCGRATWEALSRDGQNLD